MAKKKTKQVSILIIVAVLAAFFVFSPELGMQSFSSDQCQGEWLSVEKPSRVNPGDSYTVKASFKASESCPDEREYLVEAWQDKDSYKPLTVFGSTDAGRCDDNIGTAGLRTRLRPGEVGNYKFTLQDYGKEGKYRIVVGAYNGCYNDLGSSWQQFDVVHTSILVKAGTDSSNIGGSDNPVKTTPTQPSETGDEDVLATPGLAPSGEWLDMNIPSEVKPGSSYTVTGTFKADTGGSFYLEAYQDEDSFQPLTVVSATKGQCDDNSGTAGKSVTLGDGEVVQVSFTLQDYGREGKYQVRLGAYNGCFDELGQGFETYDQEALTLTVDADASSNERVSSSGGVVLGLGLTALIVIIGIIVVLFVSRRRKR